MMQLEKDLQDLKALFSQKYSEIKNKHLKGDKQIGFTVSDTLSEPKFEFVINVDSIIFDDDKEKKESL